MVLGLKTGLGLGRGLGTLLLAIVAAAPLFASAAVTIEPTTWNVIGLDSNKPATAQPAPQVFPPDRYPIGAEVCNTSGADLTGHKAVFVWDESPATNYIHLWDSTVNWNDTDANGDAIAANDVEGANELAVPTVANGACADVYFWVQIEQLSAAYDYTRDFHIELWDDSATPNDTATNGTLVHETANSGSTVGTDEARELFVEYLVSQNRNAILGFSVDGVAVAPGGSVAVKPGDTIELVIDGKTATQGYEQLEIFITLPPDLFTVKSVTTTYSADAGTAAAAGEQLYADGCTWENDPDSANYHNNGSCGAEGKYGGVIKQTLSIEVSQSFATSVAAQALIYDFSGSSYHYNADYETATITFDKDNTAFVPSGDLSIRKSTDTAAQDEFFITLTNEGTNTYAAGLIGYEVNDELPIGYKTKSGGRNGLSIEEFDANGASKGDITGGAVENQVAFYNLSASQNGGTADQSDGADYDSGERHVIWTPNLANALAPGESVTFGFQVAPQNNIVGADPYTNCALITTDDDDASNNRSCVTLPPPNWDLGITKQIVSVVGSQATFKLTVTNLGPDTSSAELVEDILPPGYSSPANFSYTGDVTLSLSARADASSGILLWDLPALTVGQTATVTYTVTVNAPTGNESTDQDLNDRYLNYARVIDAASEPNNGTYNATTQRVELLDGTVSNNVATASAAPTLLEIDKTPDGGTITGATYSYGIEVTKVGTFQAGDLITVVESPPPGMQITAISGDGWDCSGSPTLPTTQAKTCTRTVAGGDPATYPSITVAVALSPVPDGTKSYVNTSYVEATRAGVTLFNTFDSDSVRSQAQVLQADLSLAKAASNLTPSVGAAVTFTLTVTNSGPDAATNVEVTDTLPNGYQYVASSISGGSTSDDSNAASLKWTIANLANGATAQLTYQATVMATGSYKNTAEVTASDQPDPDSTVDNDDGDQSEDDEASVTLTPTPLIDLALTKTASTVAAVIGDTVTYSLALTNNGPSDATGVSVEDDLPAELSYDTGTASDSGSLSGGNLVWAGLTVSAGTTKTLTYDVTANSAGNSVINIAQVTAANETDSDSTPNNDAGNQLEDDEAAATISISATFVATPSLTLSKTGTLNDDDGTSGVSVGDTISYAFTVTNTGNVAVTDVTLADTGATVSGGPIASLAVGASDSSTFTASYTITQTDIDAGTYTNTATVTGDGTGTDDVTATDTDTQRLDGTVSLSGLVFEEVAQNYDGVRTTEQGTNGGGLFVCLSTTPAQFSQVGSSSVGAFSFSGVAPNTSYTLTLSTTGTGATCPAAATLNHNWFSTGESADGIATDSVVTPAKSLSDGKLTVAVGAADISTVTMGLVKADVFDPPFGLKTGEFLAGRPIIRWTMVWINDSPIPVTGAVITDPPPTGTTYVNGSVSCEGRGSTTVTTCGFDDVGNTVNVVADFGPETGSPVDGDTADNELVIQFDVTYDAVNPEAEYLNQGSLRWDPGSGPKTASTDDPTEAGDDDPSVVVPPAPTPPTPVPALPLTLLGLLALVMAGLGWRRLV